VFDKQHLQKQRALYLFRLWHFKVLFQNSTKTNENLYYKIRSLFFF